MFTFDFFRFPPSAQIGSHSQITWEISTVVFGSGVRTIGDNTEPFDNREVVVIPPGVPHQWAFNPDDTDDEGNVSNVTLKFDETTLKCFAELCPDLADCVSVLLQSDEPAVYRGRGAENIGELLRTMADLSNEERLPLIASVLRIISGGTPHHKLGHFRPRSASLRKLDRIRVFVECHAASHALLNETARMAGICRSSLCCLIKRHTGKTFSEYVNGVRIEKACQMLAETDDRIFSIAYDCGYTSIPYFNRVFFSIKGVTPSTFRKANRVSSPL